MKKNSLGRLLVVLLCAALIITYMPTSVRTFADETSGEPAIEQEVAEAAPAEQEAVEVAPAEQNAVSAAEESEEESAEGPAGTETSGGAEAEQAAAEPAGADDTEELLLEDTAEPALEVEAVPAMKAATGPIAVKLHLYSWDTNGEYTVVKNVNRTVSSGRLYVTLSSYVVNKEVELDGKVYKATALWKAEDGSIVNSYVSKTYDQLAELADENNTVELSYYVSYRTDIQLSLYFKDIRHANGTITEASKIQTVEAGNGSSFSITTIESLTGLRKGQTFSYAGYEYTYTGEWMDEDGNIVDASSTIWFYNREGESSGNNYYVSEDVTITLYPVWETKMIQGLDYKYIDNISTGSGSWSNADAFEYRSQFGSLTHTFKNPEDASPTLTPHYQFQYWQLDEYYQNGEELSDKEGAQYKKGDTLTYTVNSGLPQGTVTEIKIYAYWQPSVTVYYHFDGNTVEAEKFADIGVYAAAPDEFADDDHTYEKTDDGLVIDGVNYLGWYDEDGNKLDDETTYELPGLTKVPVERTVYHVHAKKAITVKAADGTWVYDGTEHTDNGVTVTKGAELVGSDVITAVNTGAITNTGSVDNEVGAITITRDGEDVTSYYEISYEKGTLQVTPAQLIITTPSARKTYDGKALRKAATADSISGLVNGETATVTATGARTAVGTSKNTYSISWGTADPSNYRITERLGTLTVTAAGGGNNPGGGGGNPDGGDDPGVTPIPDDQTPAVESTPEPEPEPTDIVDPEPPLAGGAWALINLISAILTALGAIIALFRKKEKEDEEDEAQQNTYKSEDEDEEDNRGKKMLAAKIAGAIAGVAAPIIFILTEDMSLPMVLIDKWTLLMLIVLVVQVVTAVLNKKASKLDDDDDEEVQAAAN